ncbi:APH-domain-containing protein [Aspergillus aculeatinus CBS 121060]|uniref:APH-domain-containing protein n=1 Tax=Aspergillus aculeatinus CBS 121060 TaxID=1448322 RepID=A0ACD1GW48_9EURO|nr:APH-domain-containing protein [Aspergillus aculeatinus CBS 121060]RAH65685.1 APH-domain-containing protein [Aspergillus aculeatinus CBS 121060]
MEGILSPYVDPTSRATDRPFPLDNIPLSTVTNETLAALLYTAPALHDLGQTTVVRLSQTLPPPSASSPPRSPTTPSARPASHRAFQIPDDTKYFGTMGYLVMDYIPGRPLDTCWDSLPGDQKTEIAGQVAEMVAALQRIHLPGPPGPIGKGNGNGNDTANGNDTGSDTGSDTNSKWPCRGRFFTHYSAGPFASVAAFEGWFNRKLAVCKQCRKAGPDVPAFRLGEFVLVHQDISPRNLVLDGDGQVWLVDWADAGAYPPGFETAALFGQASFPDFQALVLERLDFERDRVLEGGLRAIEWGLLTAVLA